MGQLFRISSIPHADQRYDTVGDWIPTSKHGTEILVSESGDERSDVLVAIHEIVEAFLCKHAGIEEETVSAFDICHPELEEPGSAENAPYHRQHMLAEKIERLVCEELGLTWETHCANVDKARMLRKETE